MTDLARRFIRIVIVLLLMLFVSMAFAVHSMFYFALVYVVFELVLLVVHQMKPNSDQDDSMWRFK